MCADPVLATNLNLKFGSIHGFETWIDNYLSKKKQEGPVVFLDSQLDGHPASSFGYIASNPVSCMWYRQDPDNSGSIFEFIKSGNGTDACNLENPDFWFKREESNPWEALKTYRKEHTDWMFGWLSYDLKNHTEALSSRNPDCIGLPDLFFFIPSGLLEVDRKNLCIRVLKGGNTDGFQREDDSNSGQVNRAYVPGSRDSNDRISEAVLKSGEGWQEYCGKVRRIKEYIARGDTYEVNFTHQLEGEFNSDSLVLFNKMRESGPVPFGAWISLKGTDVSCASPERFLKRRAHRIISQPIKGTSPRGANPQEDLKIISNILNKEKNRAENVMIVDLVRHDLGKVAKTGTVTTDSLLDVQSFSTVHQLVSTITAEVDPEMSSVDIIRECFPMGSMTGAPKIRTMEIIEELESYRRGLYSGAIGYFAPDDDFDFNVVIRTAIIKNDRLFYSVGGAITSDSDPRDEWEESWLKSRALPMNRMF